MVRVGKRKGWGDQGDRELGWSHLVSLPPVLALGGG